MQSKKHSNRVFTPGFDNEINIYILSNSQYADDYNFDVPVTYLTIKYRVKNNFSVEYPLTTYFYPSVTPKLKNDTWYHICEIKLHSVANIP